MCILVVALGCHPALPFICAHNRDEDRDRPSASDCLEPAAGILCGRDLRAGGMVLGLHAETGQFAALTAIRTTFGRDPNVLLSRGRLVEHMASSGSEGDGTDGIEAFFSENRGRLNGLHAVFGNVFGGGAVRASSSAEEPAASAGGGAGDRGGGDAAPQLRYVWNAPVEGDSEGRWERGGGLLNSGEIFVISNENPTVDGPWPKCLWLREQVAALLGSLPPDPRVESVQDSLAELMGRFDVAELALPARMSQYYPESKERRLQSGPYSPWREDVQDFGTVSQRMLISDARSREVHYFHRGTNIGWRAGVARPPRCGAWECTKVPWKPSATPAASTGHGDAMRAHRSRL